MRLQPGFLANRRRGVQRKRRAGARRLRGTRRVERRAQAVDDSFDMVDMGGRFNRAASSRNLAAAGRILYSLREAVGCHFWDAAILSIASRLGPALPVAPLFVVVWFLVLIRILWLDAPVDDAATLALGLLFGIGFTRIRRQTLALAAALSLAAVGFAAALDDWRALWSGLSDATTFAAFFVTLVVLRTTAERRPETVRTRHLMALLDPGQRSTATLYGANVMGSVLVVGAHAILAPVHDRNAPEPERRRAAIIALRGMGLAGLWSPFWVAMAIGLQHLPEVPLWSVMALGLALAVPALVLGQIMAGAFQGGTRTALAALLPVVPPVAVAAATVVALASFTPLRPLDALLLGIPVVCAAAQLQFGGAAIREVVRVSYDRTPSVLGELVIVTCAFVLGRVLVGGLGVLDPALWPGEGAIPAPAIIAVMIVVPAALALFGLHQIVTITVFLVLFAQVPTGVADLILFQSGLISWSIASMIGLSAISTVAAASFFHVRLERVAFGANLSFGAVIAVLGTAILSVLNAVLAG